MEAMWWFDSACIREGSSTPQYNKPIGNTTPSVVVHVQKTCHVHVHRVVVSVRFHPQHWFMCPMSNVRCEMWLFVWPHLLSKYTCTCATQTQMLWWESGDATLVMTQTKGLDWDWIEQFEDFYANMAVRLSIKTIQVGKWRSSWVRSPFPHVSILDGCRIQNAFFFEVRRQLFFLGISVGTSAEWWQDHVFLCVCDG